MYTKLKPYTFSLEFLQLHLRLYRKYVFPMRKLHVERDGKRFRGLTIYKQ